MTTKTHMISVDQNTGNAEVIDLKTRRVVAKFEIDYADDMPSAYNEAVSFCDAKGYQFF